MVSSSRCSSGMSYTALEWSDIVNTPNRLQPMDWEFLKQKESEAEEVLEITHARGDDIHFRSTPSPQPYLDAFDIPNAKTAAVGNPVVSRKLEEMQCEGAGQLTEDISNRGGASGSAISGAPNLSPENYEVRFNRFEDDFDPSSCYTVSNETTMSSVSEEKKETSIQQNEVFPFVVENEISNPSTVGESHISSPEISAEKVIPKSEILEAAIPVAVAHNVHLAESLTEEKIAEVIIPSTAEGKESAHLMCEMSGTDESIETPYTQSDFDEGKHEVVPTHSTEVEIRNSAYAVKPIICEGIAGTLSNPINADILKRESYVESSEQNTSMEVTPPEVDNTPHEVNVREAEIVFEVGPGPEVINFLQEHKDDPPGQEGLTSLAQPAEEITDTGLNVVPASLSEESSSPTKKRLNVRITISAPTPPPPPCEKVEEESPKGEEEELISPVVSPKSTVKQDVPFKQQPVVNFVNSASSKATGDSASAISHVFHTPSKQAPKDPILAHISSPIPSEEPTKAMVINELIEKFSAIGKVVENQKSPLKRRAETKAEIPKMFSSIDDIKQQKERAISLGSSQANSKVPEQTLKEEVEIDIKIADLRKESQEVRVSPLGDDRTCLEDAKILSKVPEECVRKIDVELVQKSPVNEAVPGKSTNLPCYTSKGGNPIRSVKLDFSQKFPNRNLMGPRPYHVFLENYTLKAQQQQEKILTRISISPLPEPEAPDGDENDKILKESVPVPKLDSTPAPCEPGCNANELLESPETAHVSFANLNEIIEEPHRLEPVREVSSIPNRPLIRPETVDTHGPPNQDIANEEIPMPVEDLNVHPAKEKGLTDEDRERAQPFLHETADEISRSTVESNPLKEKLKTKTVYSEPFKLLQPPPHVLEPPCEFKDTLEESSASICVPSAVLKQSESLDSEDEVVLFASRDQKQYSSTTEEVPTECSLADTASPVVSDSEEPQTFTETVDSLTLSLEVSDPESATPDVPTATPKVIVAPVTKSSWHSESSTSYGDDWLDPSDQWLKKMYSPELKKTKVDEDWSAKKFKKVRFLDAVERIPWVPYENDGPDVVEETKPAVDLSKVPMKFSISSAAAGTTAQSHVESVQKRAPIEGKEKKATAPASWKPMIIATI